MNNSFYRWITTNRAILVNAGSLIATNGVNAVLGFVFWWVAARQFLPEAVGLASAAISVMMLLGTLSILGLGTLLLGELPHHPGKEASLISAALILVGAVGACSGTLFAIISPFLSANFEALRANIWDIALFATGVSLTAITLVLDQALIGLLRGPLQFWRNMLFAVTKLVALLAVAFWLSHTMGLTIYATWAGGNTCSLVALAAFVMLKGKGSGRSYGPHWALLGKLKVAALQHHLLNLLLQAPPLILPVLVTAMLSARMNAWFYISWTMAAFVFFIPTALGTVLYAVGSAQPHVLAHKARMTVSLGIVVCLGVYAVLLPAAPQILALFGHAYEEQASGSLRILALATFPLIIKNHYITIHRIHGRIAHLLLPITTAGLLELALPALGADLDGLSGVSLGVIAALCIESLYMSPTVYRTVRSLHVGSIQINATSLPPAEIASSERIPGYKNGRASGSNTS